MKYVLGGGKNKTTQYKQPDWRHAKACMTSQLQRYLLSCAVWILSYTHTHTHTHTKPGSWEPRGHPSMRAADLQTELSDYENTAALRKASKSTPLFRLFPMHLQPGHGHLVPKHKPFLSFQSRQNPGDPNCAQYPVTHRTFCLLQMASLIAAPLGRDPIFKVGDLIHLTHVCTHTHTTSAPPPLFRDLSFFPSSLLRTSQVIYKTLFHHIPLSENHWSINPQLLY